MLGLDEFISGDKIIELANHKYNQLNSDICYNPPDNVKIIYSHTHYVNSLFEYMRDRWPFILLSHNSDGKVTFNPKNQYDANANLAPSNLVKWFGQNVQQETNKITSVPIGLENRCWFPEFNKQQQINDIIHTSKCHTNLCYMGFNVQTNPIERGYLYNRFNNCSWVTIQHCRNGDNFSQYLNMIYNHKFVLCPEGNQNGHIMTGGGVSSHRVWECIYVGTFPIITRGMQARYFDELPILFVDSWDEITEDFLNSKYTEMIDKKYNLNKAKMSYWKKEIEKTSNNRW